MEVVRTEVETGLSHVSTGLGGRGRRAGRGQLISKGLYDSTATCHVMVTIVDTDGGRDVSHFQIADSALNASIRQLPTTVSRHIPYEFIS